LKKQTKVLIVLFGIVFLVAIGVCVWALMNGKLSSLAQIMGSGLRKPSGTRIYGSISLAANCNEIKYVDLPDKPPSSNYHVVVTQFDASGKGHYYNSYLIKGDKTFSFLLPQGEYAFQVDSTCQAPNDDDGRMRTISGCQRNQGVYVTIDSSEPKIVNISDVKNPKAVVMISVKDAVTKSRVPNIEFHGIEPSGSFSGYTGSQAGVTPVLAVIGSVSVTSDENQYYYSGHAEIVLKDENVCKHVGLPIYVTRK